ncbi:hypothetical protein [Methylobacterium sp. 10]|uniref:hypothetical protein n=1 Tax=Methylobacterium sp. 10 TaxID=1101191 RepID=UPI00047F580A|nr:hypothetical protein [Methylobacterium sp. 10]
MSKKAARTITDWGGKGTRRRRRVWPHVLRAARLAFLIALMGIPVSVYFCHSLFHTAVWTQGDPSWANRNLIPSNPPAGTAAR